MIVYFFKNKQTEIRKYFHNSQNLAFKTGEIRIKNVSLLAKVNVHHKNEAAILAVILPEINEAWK